MSEFVEKLIIDDSQAVKALSNTKNLAAETGKEFEKLNDTTKKAGQAIGTEVKAGEEKAAAAVKETTAELTKKNTALSDTIKNTKIFGVSINDIQQKLTGMKNGLVEYKNMLLGSSKATVTQAKATSDMTKAMILKEKAMKGVIAASKLLKIALISTGIGALVVALGSLIAFFTKTQQGADLLSRAGAALGMTFKKIIDFASDLGEKMVKAFNDPKQAVTDLYNMVKDNIVNRFAAIPLLFGSIGKAIKEGLKGNLDGVKDAAKEAGSAIIQFTSGLDSEQQQKGLNLLRKMKDEISANVTENDKLTVSKQKLRDASNKFIAEEEKLNKLMREQINISRDDSKGLEVQLAAAKKADEIEKQLTASRLKLARERYRIVKEENALAKNMAKDYEAEYQAEAEVYRIQAESAQRQIRMNSNLNKLIQEKLDLFNGMKAAIKELAVAEGVISESEQVEIVKRQQLDLLKEYIANLKTMGASLDMDVADVVALGDQLIEKITKDLDRSVLPIPQVGVTVGKVDISKKEKEEFIEKVAEGMKPTDPIEYRIDYTFNLNEIEDITDLIREAFDFFGKGRIEFPEEDWREFLEGAAALVGEFTAIMNEATQVQLDQIDKQLESLDKRKAKLEDDLSEEQALFKEGLANNYAAKKEEVDKLLAEEERLNAEKEKLQAAAQKRQLALDTVAQASSIITSSIQIIQGFSKIPVVGLGLGIAAVAALLGFFAKTKIDAFNAVKLSSGADRIDDYFGFGDRYGNTDLAGGKGYRLVNAANGKPTNVVISGREMLLPEALSLKNEAFFNKLKSGAYDHIDLSQAIDMHKTYKSATAPIIIQQKQEKQRQFIPGKNGKYHLVTITPDMKDGTTIEIQ